MQKNKPPLFERKGDLFKNQLVMFYFNLNKLIMQVERMTIRGAIDVILKVAVLVSGATLGILIPLFVYNLLMRLID